MFIPYRVDVEHDSLPWVTLVVCALCIFVYYQQASSEQSVAPAAKAWCAQKDHSRRFWLTVQKVTGERSRKRCAELLTVVHGSGRPEAVIPVLAEQAEPWDTMSRAQSRAYTTRQLEAAVASFASKVPPTLTERLVFDPAKSDVTRMFTAAIAHGGVDHLLGNLFFFIAFAVLVEMAVGSVLYLLLLLEFAYGTHVAYAVSQLATHSSVPTLGLSGVVSGMIGMFAYLAPTMRIRCLAFFLVFWRTFAVPAWLLAAWFVGWDVYNLVHDDGTSNVNLVAHVSGAALGFATGFAFFGGTRERIRRLMAGESTRAGGARRASVPQRRGAPVARGGRATRR